MKTKKHILVIDDDYEVLDLLKDLLQRQGYAVTAVADAENLWRRLKSVDAHYNLILLDVNLPDGDGVRLSQEITNLNYDIPIILMTAQGNEEDHLLGLEFGADDYIEKPFNLRTLTARINVVLRRHQSGSISKPENSNKRDACIYKFNGWVLDTKKRTLSNPKGLDIAITKGVYDILLLLIEGNDRTLTREYLSEATKTEGIESFDRAVDAQIARLRKFIEEDPNNPQIIKTIRGVGYTFDASLETLR